MQEGHMNSHKLGAMLTIIALAAESARIMRGYEAHHLGKIEEEGRAEKAKVNSEIAGSLENALASFSSTLEFDPEAFRELCSITNKAARTFRTYESHHRAKDGPDRTERADRNADIAERIERTIGALSAWQTLEDRQPK